MSGVRNLAILIVVLGLILWAAGPGWAAPMGTAFSYQGQLMDAGSPAEGIYDFKFELYDEPDGGIQHGHPLLIDDVGVMGGGFTVGLDFGDDPNLFNGEARWLEMGVRPGEMGGPDDYMILMPRQQLTATPYALALRGFRTQGGPSPNLIGGWKGNSIAPGVVGATIGGGGIPAELDPNGFPRANRITDSYGTIGGGTDNQAGDGDGATSNACWGSVGGGTANTASGTYATVAGGYGNTASGFASTVGGGYWNDATKGYSTVGGGYLNNATAEYATIAGGSYNDASGTYATVGGGYNNDAKGTYSTAGGGFNNEVNGYCATVPGGYGNLANGDYSLAVGFEAQADHKGTFVWADYAGGLNYFTSTAEDQFLVRAAGGVGIGTNTPHEQLEVNGKIRMSGGDYSTTLSNSGGALLIESTYPNATASGRIVVYENDIWLQNTDSTGNIYLSGNVGNNLSGNIILKTSGKVGINTVSPGQKLDIVGGNGRVETGYSWLTNSDIRYKENLTGLSNTLSKVTRLRAVRYDVRDAENTTNRKGSHIGVVAQELETEYPELVVTDEKGYKSVAYDKLGAILIEAIKELKIQHDERLTALEQENAVLRSELADVQKDLDKARVESWRLK